MDKEELKQNLEGRGSMERIATEEFLSIRDVNRYANSLRNSYEKLAGNVVLRDLMNLEILRFVYQPVYELLSWQREQVLSYKDGALKLYEIEKDKKRVLRNI